MADDVNHNEEAPILRESNRRLPRLFVAASIDHYEEGIEEDLARLLEGDAVFEDVAVPAWRAQWVERMDT